MDAREKAIEAIQYVLTEQTAGMRSVILALPELEAYFREKFEQEPTRLVATRECKGGPFVIYPKHPESCTCKGTGIIKRTLTRREIEEWLVKQIESDNVNKDNFVRYRLPSGERITVEEK